MNLGIFLSPGESLRQMKRTGQDKRFMESYIAAYSKHFEKIYIFSYENETCELPSNVLIIPNKTNLPRLMYAFLLPVLKFKKIRDCDVIRGFGLASFLSAILLLKPYVFNWAYNYPEVVRKENKILYVPAYFILERLAFAKAKKVFIATKNKFNKLKGSKYIYLPNGVNLKRFSYQKTAGKRLVFVGRFERQKNLFFLIEAISNLPQKERSATFIGSGSQEEELRKYASEKGITLKILKPVSNQELPKLLRQFSIFALTSLAEGSPKALLEAMAIGLVPIVTNFRTAKEVVQDGVNGYIAAYDVKEYSDKLKFLLRDAKLTKRISQNARQTIIKNFNLDDLILIEIKVMKQIAS